jgi:hypothetical protein
MQPREGTLDDPARAPETRAVQRPVPGELHGDPAERELVPMRLRVVSPVPLNQVRLADRSPRPPAQRRNVVDQRQQLGDVVHDERPSQARDERDALPVREEEVFAPSFTTIGWVRSSFFHAQRADRRTVDHRTGQVQAAAPPQFGQQYFVDPLPHAGPLPGDQPTPTDRPGPTAHLARQHVPRNAATEDEQNAREDGAVGNRLAPGVSAMPGRARGQKRFDQGPQSASSSNGLVMCDRLPVGHAKTPRRDQKYKR